jgi:hypothetical protein
MSTGTHGQNGLSVSVCFHIFTIFVLPVLIFGLEVLLPTETELHDAVVFYEDTLRRLLSLPNSVAKPALYIILGALPLESIIHKKALGMFGSIARDDQSLDCDIAQRRVLVHAMQDPSWFSRIRRLLARYNLPPAQAILDSPPSKGEWSALVKRNVAADCADNIRTLATLYQYLRYLHTGQYSPGTCHPIIYSQCLPCLLTQGVFVINLGYLQEHSSSSRIELNIISIRLTQHAACVRLPPRLSVSALRSEGPLVRRPASPKKINNKYKKKEEKEGPLVRRPASPKKKAR